MKRQSMFVVGTILLAVTVSLAVGINAQEPSKKLRIIYTNDLTGFLEPCK